MTNNSSYNNLRIRQNIYINYLGSFLCLELLFWLSYIHIRSLLNVNNRIYSLTTENTSFFWNPSYSDIGP